MSVVVLTISIEFIVIAFMTKNYETLATDKQKCFDVQTAMDEERNIFMDLVRDPSQRNNDRFAKAREKSRQRIDAIPRRYEDIGEDRAARTWNLLNGYEGYELYRDQFLQMDPSDESYSLELYRIVDMQDSLNQYARRLLQATMEFENRHYRNAQAMMHLLPIYLIILTALSFVVVLYVLKLLSSTVVSPILLLAEESKSIAKNDFSRPDIPEKREDEVGVLIRSFNRMKHAMADYIATREQLHQQEVVQLRMEKDLEHTRLEMLKSQVNPHFLFNTLNMISCMARLEDAQTTDRMIVRLGNLFRYNLRTKEQQVYLEQELDALDDYVYIQQMRYDDRITFHKDIRVSPERVRIPAFTLQPLVENAFTHGLQAKEEGGRILLRIWNRGNNLIISLTDNGVGMDIAQKELLVKKIRDSEKTGKSIGLGNIYHRMAVLYPDGQMKIYSRKGAGTIIQLIFPQDQETEGVE